MSQLNSPFQLDLRPTLGAWFIGAIASVGLVGVVSLQCWTYLLRFPNDPRILKTLASSKRPFVLSSHLPSLKGPRSLEHEGEQPLLRHWPQFESKGINKVMILLANTVILLAHLFFAHKVWLLTHRRHWWIPMIIIIFSLADFAFGMATFIASLINANYETIIFGKAGRFATAGLGCAIIADWTTTASLVIFLRAEQGSQPNIGLTNKFISKLVFYTINIGLLVGLADLITLVLLNVKFKSLNLYQLMSYEIIGNLYANTLLACLNMRSAPSSLELSELAKSQHYSSMPYDRALISPRRTGSSQPSSIRHDRDSDRSNIGMNSIEYKSAWMETATDRRNRAQVIKPPGIVVTKTTVTTTM
ncbi:hypothetical protein P691DRAFT_777531 [Macrolepiota fuliginosa MF-IS2]|uniref:DUF6534 domain-containing protein n=1 Tax=Macrolepiota fuliginosa MF-IS2 TaxID=1400762 RepID=A0A9P5X888_9AGAR|nr:hypothetical protein P691DRAFT_777531 [Macrolepiota fuliginosa MF-IS2]